MDAKKKTSLTFIISTALVAVAAVVAILGSCGQKSDALTTLMSQDCTACHGADTTYNVKGARAQYVVSGHATLGDASYANGGGCQVCHTHEGFLDYLETGTVDSESFVENPSQPGCFTCHDPHETGDFTLVSTNAVKLDNGESFDAGNGNLCASCHKVRGDASRSVVETEAAKLSVRFGPHHGPQADMFLGTNGYEYADMTYSSAAHTNVIKDGCTSCHMALPEGRYSLSPGIGGHSFAIAGEVHESEVLNGAGCVGCHDGITQVRGEDVFSKQAPADYDGDGKVEPAQREVEGLLATLVNPSGTGLLQTLNPPMYDTAGARIAAKSGTYSKEQVGALYNYDFVLEDRSRGIHNMKYAVQLLMDSIAALNPSYDASARPQ